MAKIIQVFNKKYHKHPTLKDFKKTGKTYTKVKNGIKYCFDIQAFLCGNCCTVNYGVEPLCGGFTYLDRYLLYQCGIYNDYPRNLHFDPTSEQSISDCADTIFRFLTEHVLPFFDKCKDENSACTAMCELEGWENCYNNRPKLDFMLKVKNYKRALHYLGNIKEEWICAIKTNLIYDVISDDVRERYRNNFIWLNNMIRIAKEEDDIALEEWIAEQEAISFETLAKYKIKAE